ncbi:MAG: DUF1028 domain-containing protein [bacterium]
MKKPFYNRLYLLIVLLLFLGILFSEVSNKDFLTTSTFSIVAYDPEIGEWGVGVSSRVLAVGYIVPWAKAGVGAIATQALANLDYGVEGLKFLESGMSAQDTLNTLLEKDTDREQRQVSIIDRDGNIAVFTGGQTLPWSGSISGVHYSVQGNILTDEEVLKAMEKAFIETDGPLARRIVNALIEGESAGGDKRGKESSAILVVKEGGGYQGKTDRLVDIRVDDNPEPVKELERIYNLWEANFLVSAYLDSKGEKEKEYALGIIDRILSENPDNAEVYNSVAWALATRKLYPERALEIALKAHELAPDDPNIMDTLAESYYANGEYKKAIKWEKKALKIEPNNEFFKKQLEKFKIALKNK